MCSVAVVIIQSLPADSQSSPDRHRHSGHPPKRTVTGADRFPTATGLSRPTTVAPTTTTDPPTTTTTEPTTTTTAPPAPAPSTPPSSAGLDEATYEAWTRVADCEEGGWIGSAGPNYPDSLGIKAQAWYAYGGGSDLSPAAQIAVAQRLLAANGDAGWVPDQDGCAAW
jgi:hypothetical protein